MAPSTAVAPREPSEVTRSKATELSQSKLMPEHFADNPANVQYVMEIGKALGIEPVSALTHVHVFPDSDGKLKCGLSADLMVALARAAGHTVHVQGNQTKATATLIRGDVTMEKIETWKALGLDPKEYVVFEEVWTQTRAHEIGLMNKWNWKNYTQEMLKARVKSAVVRSGCSEVLIGVANLMRSMGVELSDEMDDTIALTSARYTPDELGAETDEEGRPLPKAPRPQQAARKPKTQAQPQQPQADLSPAQQLVSAATADEIVQWAANTIASDETDAEKLKRIRLVHEACKAADRLETPVTTDDKSTTLGKALVGYAQPLMPKTQ